MILMTMADDPRYRPGVKVWSMLQVTDCTPMGALYTTAWTTILEDD